MLSTLRVLLSLLVLCVSVYIYPTILLRRRRGSAKPLPGPKDMLSPSVDEFS